MRISSLIKLFGNSEAAPELGLPIYAIGDIHGRLDLLVKLLQRIALDLRETGMRRSRLVVVGDFIDRGPWSAQLIDFFLNLKDSPLVTVLKGNHEALLCDVLDGDFDACDLWLAHGGAATLRSYGIKPSDIDEDDARAVIQLVKSLVRPEAHAWLKSLPHKAVFGDFCFVHAGIRPGIALDDQSAADCLWIRGDFTESKKPHGTTVVHGHTIYEHVHVGANRIGIDTGAFRSNRLSAVRVEPDSSSVTIITT